MLYYKNIDMPTTANKKMNFPSDPTKKSCFCFTLRQMVGCIQITGQRRATVIKMGVYRTGHGAQPLFSDAFTTFLYSSQVMLIKIRVTVINY